MNLSHFLHIQELNFIFFIFQWWICQRHIFLGTKMTIYPIFIYLPLTYQCETCSLILSSRATSLTKLYFVFGFYPKLILYVWTSKAASFVFYCVDLCFFSRFFSWTEIITSVSKFTVSKINSTCSAWLQLI